MVRKTTLEKQPGKRLLKNAAATLGSKNAPRKVKDLAGRVLSEGRKPKK